MLFREIIIHFEKHMEHIHTTCGKIQNSWMLQQLVRVVTTVRRKLMGSEM